MSRNEEAHKIIDYLKDKFPNVLVLLVFAEVDVKAQKVEAEVISSHGQEITYPVLQSIFSPSNSDN